MVGNEFNGGGGGGRDPPPLEIENSTKKANCVRQLDGYLEESPMKPTTFKGSSGKYFSYICIN